MALTLREMREIAKKASMEKHKNEDVDLTLIETSGNKGADHSHREWEITEKEPEEKSKIEIMLEREAEADKKERRRNGEEI